MLHIALSHLHHNQKIKEVFFFGCDADDTMQYVVFLNSFDVSGLYLEILFLVTCVCLLDPEI